MSFAPFSACRAQPSRISTKGLPMVPNEFSFHNHTELPALSIAFESTRTLVPLISGQQSEVRVRSRETQPRPQCLPIDRFDMSLWVGEKNTPPPTRTMRATQCRSLLCSFMIKGRARRPLHPLPRLSLSFLQTTRWYRYRDRAGTLLLAFPLPVW